MEGRLSARATKFKCVALTEILSRYAIAHYFKEITQKVRTVFGRDHPCCESLGRL